MASSWACSRPSCLSLAGLRAVWGSGSCRATFCARASAWRSRVSTESARFGSVLLAEPLHAAGRVEQLLFAREKGVTAGADFDVDHGRGRARDEGIAARALDCRPLIFWMNPGFHCTHPCLIVDGNEGWKYSWHSNLEARFALFIQLTPRGTHRKLFRVSAAEVLQKVPLFSQLSAVDLQRVVEVARDRAYPKNSVILFEDDPGDALYVVAKGQVKVVLIGEDEREVILSVLGEGEFFGEMALIDDEPRSAHVIAMEDSTLLVLRREDFQGILKQTPAIALALLRELSRRLRRVDEKVGSLVLLDVNGRVAQLLLDLADEAGSDKITRRLTHHTIAQMIGSSRETVSRTMRELVDKGYIEISRREILIRDRAALEASAGRSRGGSLGSSEAAACPTSRHFHNLAQGCGVAGTYGLHGDLLGDAGLHPHPRSPHRALRRQYAVRRRGGHRRGQGRGPAGHPGSGPGAPPAGTRAGGAPKTRRAGGEPAVTRALGPYSRVTSLQAVLRPRQPGAHLGPPPGDDGARGGPPPADGPGRVSRPAGRALREAHGAASGAGRVHGGDVPGAGDAPAPPRHHSRLSAHARGGRPEHGICDRQPARAGRAPRDPRLAAQGFRGGPRRGGAAHPRRDVHARGAGRAPGMGPLDVRGGGGAGGRRGREAPGAVPPRARAPGRGNRRPGRGGPPPRAGGKASPPGRGGGGKGGTGPPLSGRRLSA